MSDPMTSPSPEMKPLTKPCPFCKCPMVNMALAYVSSEPSYWAACHALFGCGAKGPPESTEEKAVEKWNHRCELESRVSQSVPSETKPFWLHDAERCGCDVHSQYCPMNPEATDFEEERWEWKSGRWELREPLDTRRVLKRLEEWCRFSEGDGYITAHYADGGMVTLSCGKEIGISDSLPDCGHTPPIEAWGKSPEMDRDLIAASSHCDCPNTSWVVEFTTHGVKQGSSVPLTHCQHCYAFGKTFDDAIAALFIKVAAGQVCECPETPDEPTEPVSSRSSGEDQPSLAALRQRVAEMPSYSFAYAPACNNNPQIGPCMEKETIPEHGEYLERGPVLALIDAANTNATNPEKDHG